MNILKQITMYKKFKEVLNRVHDGDSIVGQAMANALTVEQINDMEAFVAECEEWGIHLITPKEKN